MPPCHHGKEDNELSILRGPYEELALIFLVPYLSSIASFERDCILVALLTYLRSYPLGKI